MSYECSSLKGRPIRLLLFVIALRQIVNMAICLAGRQCKVKPTFRRSNAANQSLFIIQTCSFDALAVYNKETVLENYFKVKKSRKLQVV